MQGSRRSKVGLSIIGMLALICALAALAPSAQAAHAASRSTAATYVGTHGTTARLAKTSGMPTAPTGKAATQQGGDRMIPYRTPSRSSALHPSTALTRGAPLAPSSALAPGLAEGSQAHNFNGLSNKDQSMVSGIQPTPPDQGLCAGNLNFRSGGPTVVWELVNDAAALYSTSGTRLLLISLPVLFSDPSAFSDPRCFYDTATNTFFFTVIGFVNSGPHKGDSTADIAVINANGYAAYQVDTSNGGTCFGDQPHIGYDQHGFYISTDEFCGPAQNIYEGALLFGLSKAQLVAESATVHMVTFGPLSLGGDPILTLEPAFGFPSETEYLLNSFPFDQFGNSNSIANTLGFWRVTGDQALDTGTGTVTLHGQIITSETYAFPQPAASTGDGSIHCVVGNHPKAPCPDSLEPIQSEPFLNPDDSRMLQVQLVKDDKHGLQLYAALDSAVTINHDPSARDGVAWFVLNPGQHKITSQGYVAVAGAYLLYPAILHTHEGTTAIAFTITSPTINPSTAFVVKKSTSNAFGSVQISGAGTGPHMSFAGPIFGTPRWGDYSAEELDPNGVDIWSASEYIPPLADQATRDNWGTRVWDVTGDH